MVGPLGDVSRRDADAKLRQRLDDGGLDFHQFLGIDRARAVHVVLLQQVEAGQFVIVEMAAAPAERAFPSSISGRPFSASAIEVSMTFGAGAGSILDPHRARRRLAVAGKPLFAEFLLQLARLTLHALLLDVEPLALAGAFKPVAGNIFPRACDGSASAWRSMRIGWMPVIRMRLVT